MVSTLSSLLQFAETPPGDTSQGQTYALYTMISAIAVALISVLGQLLMKDRRPRTEQRAVTAERYEAIERFLLLNDIDPRKILTGYESMEEVRHAAPE